MHTTYLIACRSGKLANVLNELAERLCAVKNGNHHRNRKTVHLESTRLRAISAHFLEDDSYDNGLVIRDVEDTHSDCYNNDEHLSMKIQCSSAYAAGTNNLKLENETKDIIISRDVIKWSTACLTLGWIFLVANSGVVMYLLFFTEYSNTTLAPIQTYIFPTYILPAKIVSWIIILYLSAGWSFPMAMSLFIALCLSKEFQVVYRQFKEAVILDKLCTGGRGGSFTGEVESYRVRHQKIVRHTKKADNFLSFYYGVSVVGHIAMGSIMFYVVIIFPGFLSMPIFAFIGCFWVITSFLELSIAAFGAVLVNNAVSTVRHAIYSSSFSIGYAKWLTTEFKYGRNNLVHLVHDVDLAHSW